MESLLLYAVVAAAIALMLAGAYGAAPVVFTRRHASGPAQGGLGHAFALGAAFPLLEKDLALGLKAMPAVAEPDQRNEGPHDDEPNGAYEEDEAARASTPSGDETLLPDLVAEIEMLRAQMAGLRSELVSFAGIAAAKKDQRQATSEPRRRYRPQAAGELPLPLRRRLSDICSERRTSRPEEASPA